MGKRELGQVSVLDLVAILLISNAVQNAMVGPDVSLVGGVVAAATLLVTNRLLAAWRLRGGRWGRVLEGPPTVLVADGEYILPHLRQEELDQSEVEMAMREHGAASVREVKLAVLETDGSISIVPRDAPVMRTHRHVRQPHRR